MEPTKRCPKCEIEKPFTPDYFARNKTATYGLAGWCKDCMKAYRVTKGLNKGKTRPEPPPGMRQCSRCGLQKPATTDYWSPNKELTGGLHCWCRSCGSEAMKISNQKKKVTVLSHYSPTDPPSCACCGEATLVFLALDHINGGGTKQRQEVGQSGVDFYRWVIQNGFPGGLRVLCCNCNWAFRCLGYCPHHPPTK